MIEKLMGLAPELRFHLTLVMDLRYISKNQKNFCKSVYPQFDWLAPLLRGLGGATPSQIPVKALEPERGLSFFIAFIVFKA